MTNIYRLFPCPSYDIQGMENWLEEQAKKGFVLNKDGILGDIVSFKKSAPTCIRYRLEAAKKSTSMWSENYGEPDEDEIELSKKYSWEYIGKRGNFYIYCSSDDSARELNTDP